MAGNCGRQTNVWNIRLTRVLSRDFIDGPMDKMGLVSEDFHTVFERGSDKKISGQEVQMALWLAVQELTKENEDLRKPLSLNIACDRTAVTHSMKAGPIPIP